MRKKILFITVLVLLSLFSIFSFASASNDIMIWVNGRFITTEAQPQIIDGRVMIPARFVAEALYADVDWNETSQIVFIEWPQKIKFGIRLVELMEQNRAFGEEIIAVYNKYYANNTSTFPPSSTTPSTPPAPNQTNNFLRSQIQSQINSIKANAESQREAIESAYNIAKQDLDRQRDAALLEVTHSIAARNLSGSPLANYERQKVYDLFDPMYKQLEEEKEQKLDEVNEWEDSMLAPLESQLEALQ